MLFYCCYYPVNLNFNCYLNCLGIKISNSLVNLLLIVIKICLIFIIIYVVNKYFSYRSNNTSL